MKKLINNEVVQKIIIAIASLVLIYLLISIYFTNHFFFHTVINGVDLSLKSYKASEQIINNYINDYELQIIERDGDTEIITGREIGMHYNKNNSISKIYHMQRPFLWIGSFFKDYKYFVTDLYMYNKADLVKKINGLSCLQKKVIEAKNVDFRYSNGSYEIIKEEMGNKINKYKLSEAIKIHMLKGKTIVNLEENQCYETPKYTINSAKTLKTRNLLELYISTKITYQFGSKSEILDGTIISRWLSVDANLDVIISKAAIKKYIKELSKKYDTVGTVRNFKTSNGKIVEVKGGLYGWKMNQEEEAKALLEYIKLGQVVEKEPAYIQTALSRDGDEIGNTYVEINITRQHLWFYKDGKLIVEGPVVTGNPNRGNSTALGIYMLNYKQNGATLKGPGYEAKVTYWMPFYGNMGIHDASWRYSFGGEIYKSRGTHGCVNAPYYLAKTIYENIKVGVPVICYEE